MSIRSSMSDCPEENYNRIFRPKGRCQQCGREWDGKSEHYCNVGVKFTQLQGIDAIVEECFNKIFNIMSFRITPMTISNESVHEIIKGAIQEAYKQQSKREQQ